MSRDEFLSCIPRGVDRNYQGWVSSRTVGETVKNPDETGKNRKKLEEIDRKLKQCPKIRYIKLYKIF